MQEALIRLLMWSPLVIVAFVYPLAAYVMLKWAPARWRDWAFAVVNLCGAYGLCLAGLGGLAHDPAALMHLARVVALGFSAYVAFAVIEYALIRLSRGDAAWLTAAWFPIVVLAMMKYILPGLELFQGGLAHVGVVGLSALFLGLSYTSFRLCRLVQEVRNEQTPPPSLPAFLSFTFFVPTLTIGPISPYERFIRSYEASRSTAGDMSQPVLRILIGLTKYFAFSPILAQFTYNGLLLDGHPHYAIDVIIAVFAYTLYLYCNFSGYCDIAIGVAGVIGIDVMENFNSPFLSRNMQILWNRWHISLSVWLRDLMFTPLVKALTRRSGPSFYNHAVAISIVTVFLVIGVWHGSGVNFALLGLSQGVALAMVHYYTVFLKRRLGKQGYSAYMNNSVIRVASTVATFVYFSLSLSLLANSWGDLVRLARVGVGAQF
jgi:D-alanyl-lipoteichoic acid acyltransferase DltB (MBOAT superfamily)